MFGVIFWDYSKIPFNLGGRINLLYCFFWGFAAVAWVKLCYPYVMRGIGFVRSHTGRWLTVLVGVFMVVNMAVSGLALIRSDARSEGEPPANALDRVPGRPLPRRGGWPGSTPTQRKRKRTGRAAPAMRHKEATQC